MSSAWTSIAAPPGARAPDGMGVGGSGAPGPEPVEGGGIGGRLPEERPPPTLPASVLGGLRGNAYALAMRRHALVLLLLLSGGAGAWAEDEAVPVLADATPLRVALKQGRSTWVGRVDVP